MNLVFGIVTSTENPASVAQLVRAIGPRHRVLIHHDLTKQPALGVDGPNVSLVPEPLVTGWGTWGLCQAIIKTARTAVETGPCDYFQLLSGNCLPIKPIEVFAEAVARRPYDVNMDLIDLDQDRQALFSHGARVFARRGTLLARVLQRAANAGLGPDAVTEQRAGLGIERRRDESAPLPLAARLGQRAIVAAREGRLGRHPFHGSIRPFVASMWFGCNAKVCRYLSTLDPDDPLERYFSQMIFADEAYFGSRIGNAGFRIGPSNHLISRFEGANPVTWTLGDLDRLARSPAFFARKFPREADAPVRERVLERLLQAQGAPLS